MKHIIEERHYLFKFSAVYEQFIITVDSIADEITFALMDDGGASSGTSSNARYIIFSACGYGNIGDDAIMLGIALQKSLLVLEISMYVRQIIMQDVLLIYLMNLLK
jgi:hypothetical protein